VYGVGVGLASGQLWQKRHVLALGALAPHLVEAPAGQGRDRRQHATTAGLAVGLVLLGGRARLRRYAVDGFPQQQARPLSQATHGPVRVVGAGVEAKHRFEAGQILPVDAADTPLALAVRLQRVFLRRAWTEPTERWREWPRATALPASRRKDHWLRRSGAGEQATAVRLARSGPVLVRGRPLRGWSKSRSKPRSAKRVAHANTVA